MGNTFALGPDHVVPFVDASQEHVTEMNRPDAIVDLLEPDMMLLERVGRWLSFEASPGVQADLGGLHPRARWQISRRVVKLERTR